MVRFGLAAVEVAGIEHLGDHGGLDGARANSVDADAAGGVFDGGAEGQADDAMLGGVVGATAWEPDQPAERGAVDDRSGALGAHLGELVLHAGPDAAQIDGVDPVEHLGGLVGGVDGGGLDAGVVVGHVQAAERLDGPGDGGGDLVLVGDVAAHGKYVVPGVAQLGLGRVEGVGVDIGVVAAPASAKARAVASPIPELAPVTRAIWPVKS